MSHSSTEPAGRAAASAPAYRLRSVATPAALASLVLNPLMYTTTAVSFFVTRMSRRLANARNQNWSGYLTHRYDPRTCVLALENPASSRESPILSYTASRKLFLDTF